MTDKPVLSSLPCEDTARRRASVSQEGPSPGTCASTLDFATCSAGREQCLFFQPPRLGQHFIPVAQADEGPHSNGPFGVGIEDYSSELHSCPHIKNQATKSI